MARKLAPRTLLHRLLAASKLPIYLLDDERRIVFCNPACADCMGVSEQQLLGLRCDYHSQPRAERSEELAALLCPPPDALAGRPMSAEIHLPTSSPLRAHYIPLGGGDAPSGAASSQAVLVWLAPDDPARADPWTSTPGEVLPEQLHQWLQSLRRDQSQRHAPRQVVGTTPAIRRVRRQLRLAQSADRVLITGPPGSGREHLARTIHYARARRDEPLIPLSCGLLDAELLETTLDAFLRHSLEQPNAGIGTLLLLDIEQLPAESQATLQQVLGTDQLNWFTLTTSSRPLRTLVAEERFREDLACSLGILEITLPPLRERTADIPVLAQLFLEEHNAKGGRQYSGLADDTLDLLAAYDWPENVDELARAIEQACGRATGNWITPDDLPREIRVAEAVAARPRQEETPIELDAFLEQVERELIQRALRKAKGNKAQASRLLGISRARFHRRLAQLGLD